MTHLHIRVLGDFGLTYDGESVVGMNTARLQSLLAYLVLHRDAPQLRQRLAFLFWPDSSEAQALTNLRQLLHHLRRGLLGAELFLCADASTLQWRADSSFTLDAAEFEEAVGRADEAERNADQASARMALERAAQLYRGDLLPGCYDEWIEPERQRLRQMFTGAQERLVRLLEDWRDYDFAIDHARRLLRHDPLHEAGYRTLMRLHAVSGDRTRALSVYDACAAALQRELGVEPGTVTRQAYELLLKADSHEALRSAPLAPVAGPALVGRRQEWERLQAAWRAAARGRSHFVLMLGEAGIGKTRLVEELRRWARQQGIATAGTRSYAAEGQLAYGPLTEWLRADVLKESVSGMDEVWLTEVARLLPELLTERPGLPQPEPMTEGWQRQRLFEALARSVLSGERPLLLMIDDLQWCDRETIEWLHYLLRFEPAARLMVVGTVRSEELEQDHPLASLLSSLRRGEQVTEIELGPLEADETVSLAEQAAGRKLDSDLTTHLHMEAEGNPLFVVEAVRAGLFDRTFEYKEQGAEAPVGSTGSPSHPLPPKVRAVIESRLDRLSSPARELVELAATVGREFTVEVLFWAGDNEEDILVQVLDGLRQVRIMRENGAEAYDFSHDKIREVAYARLSPARRRLLHRRVAQALQQIHAAGSSAGPEQDTRGVSGQLAAHYERAGRLDQAIPNYQRAAEVARGLYANEEAIRLLYRGLALLDALPESVERDERELALQTALGVPLVAIKGYGATEVTRVYNRALALGRVLGKPEEPPVLRALAIAALVRGDLRQARELGEQLLELARSVGDSMPHVEAYYVLGVTSFWRGEFAAAREQLEGAIAHYEPRQHRSHVALYSQDPKVICLSRLAYTLWYLGYPDEAVIRSQQALDLARELSHPYSLAYALNFATWLHNDLRNEQEARRQMEAGATLSGEQRLGFLQPMGIIFRGWVLVEQGEVVAGIDRIQEGLNAYGASGQDLYRPYALSLLARAYGRAGEPERGLTALTEALTMVQRTEERFWEAELYRLRGELLLARGEYNAEVKDSFVRALEVSRGQGARSLELRAALSLARLWGSLERLEDRVEVRWRLKEVYDQFTEGLDTADLQEARALLEELDREDNRSQQDRRV